MKQNVKLLTVSAILIGLAGCGGETSGVRSDSHINHGSYVDNRCAEAVAREVGVSANDVIVTNSTISEGTGNHVVYVGVPYGKADWICEADRNGQVVNVFYSGEG